MNKNQRFIGIGFLLAIAVLAVGIFSIMSFGGKMADNKDIEPVDSPVAVTAEPAVQDETALDADSTEADEGEAAVAAEEDAQPESFGAEAKAAASAAQSPEPQTEPAPEPDPVASAPEPEPVAPTPEPEPVAPAPEPEPEPAGPTGTVSAESSVMSFGEGIGFAKVKITCNCSGGAVTFFHKTSDGSAADGADYMGNPGGAYMTFEEGQTTKNVGFLIINDTESESNENFYISITTSHPGVTVGTPKVTMTVEDND